MIQAFLPYLALLALIGGPEIPVSDPVIGPRPGLRFTPRVATNGDDYLIVWAEVAEIRAARVDDEGRVLDAGGIRVASGSGNALAVASDGRDYVIAYNCSVNDDAYSRTPSVCLAHLDAASGSVEQRGRIELATNPVIASARGRYLVAYQTPYSTSPTGRYVDGVEVAADASVIGAPFRIGTSPYRPEIASNGSDSYVIWSTYGDLKGAFVRGNAVEPAETLTTERPSWGPGPFSWTVGSNGSAFMVVWQQNVGVRGTGYVTELRALPVSNAGAPDRERQKTLVTGEQPTWSPQVTWDGAKYLVTYTFNPLRATAPYIVDRSATDIHELGLSADGEIVEGPRNLSARENSEAFSSAASNGTSTLVAWERQLRPDAARIEATFTGSASSLAIPVSVSAQQNLAGADATVAWEEILGDEQKRTVFVRRLQGSGRGTPVAASEKHQVLPALSRSFITWIERDLEQTTAEVFVKRTFSNEQPVRLGAAERTSGVAIAETSSDALVVWVSPQRQIVGAWIQRGGEPFVISSEGSTHNPVIATDGENFLVTWEKEESCVIFCFWTSLHAAVVTSSGVVQPAIELAEEPVSNASAVWNGNEYVVFWNQRGITARRIQRSGLPLGPAVTVRDDAFANNVLWNGREYLVAITGSRAFIPLTAARLDRDLRLIDFAGISNTYAGGTRVVLLDGWIAYQSRNADAISRAVARMLDVATVGKRRSAR